jgi:hypothetical protein
VQNERATPGSLIRAESERHRDQAPGQRRRKRLIAFAVAIACGILAFLAVRFGLQPVFHFVVDRLVRTPHRPSVVPASTATTAAKIVAVVVMIGALRTMWPVKTAR